MSFEEYLSLQYAASDEKEFMSFKDFAFRYEGIFRASYDRYILNK